VGLSPIVKLGSSVCPWHMDVSPSWYQLVAVRRSNGKDYEVSEDSNDGGSPTGQTEMNNTTENYGSMEGVFFPIKINQEVHHCDFNKVSLSSNQIVTYTIFFNRKCQLD